ncbi:MAG TPA: dihydroxyacetone kinase phosphoryl donor subunit DhaM, partial [Terriglobia bacterium]|nr:dihydroxyacetone kinase phosphoryl donor subunit DhaM [Terriglobia bacterium]
MVSLVLVSHSRELAAGVRELVLQAAGPDFPVAVAAGAGEEHEQIGTDAVYISEVVGELWGTDGVVVLMDLGSAVLSATMALELLEQSEGAYEACRERVRLCPAPLVEGAIAAAVAARGGGSLDDVCREALGALAPKEEQLRVEPSEKPPKIPEPPPASLASSPPRELALTVENEHGLHARPAARLVQTASRFSSTIEITNQTAGRGPAPARSLTSLALLQVRKGDEIRVEAHGADAEAALEAVATLAAAGFGEREDTARRTPSETATETVADRGAGRRTIPEAVGFDSQPNLRRGTPAAEGIAIGPLRLIQEWQPSASDEPPAEPLADPQDAAAELARFKRATRRVAERLAAQGSGSGGAAAGEASQIFAAQAAILNDPVVLDQVKALVERKRLRAAPAWAEVTRSLIASYQSLDDPYLRERAADLGDLSRLVLEELAGASVQPLPAGIQPRPPAILLARELSPLEAAACDPDAVLGVITREGSPTTHSAIMLRTVGIPMVTAIRGLDTTALAGKIVALDGGTGEVWIEPAGSLRQDLEERQREWRDLREKTAAAAALPAVTLDGERVEVLVNVASAAEAVAAARNGAEGIGVLRSELLFLSRRDAPTEQEQVDALRAILAPFPPAMPVVVRALDAGADKPLAFLPQPAEQNPYLGVRGIRLLLQNPDFLLAHLKAILAAGAGRNLGVMFPMVSEVGEAELAAASLLRAHQELRAAE